MSAFNVHTIIDTLAADLHVFSTHRVVDDSYYSHNTTVRISYGVTHIIVEHDDRSVLSVKLVEVNGGDDNLVARPYFDHVDNYSYHRNTSARQYALLGWLTEAITDMANEKAKDDRLEAEYQATLAAARKARKAGMNRKVRVLVNGQVLAA